MALLSQQVLAGRMPEAHVMENLHAAFVFFTGREPPPEAKTGASCVDQDRRFLRWQCTCVSHRG